MLPDPQLPVPNLNAIVAEATPNQQEVVGARKELKEWLKEDKERKKHERQEREKNMLHYILLALMVVAGFGVGIGIVVRIVHLILPTTCYWLSEGQVSSIDNLAKLAGSGFLGGLLQRYISRSIDDKGEKED